jgi:hypothetical protein
MAQDGLEQIPNPKIRKSWCMGLQLELTVYNLTDVHSRVDSNTLNTMGSPMPESTLSPSQGHWIWPLYRSSLEN